MVHTRLLFVASFFLLLHTQILPAAAQENCVLTSEGRTCKVQQPITFGTLVSVDLQRQLGLVTVNGGCSGTLLNRWWVLTARHCVQVRPQDLVRSPPFPPLLQPNQVNITATWAPGRTGRPSRFVELGGAALRDIILIYLGHNNLGDADWQQLYIFHDTGFLPVGRRLETTDTVTQYGQGLSTFATGGTGGAPVVLGAGAGVYRSAQFAPSNITETGYDLAMNASSQVGHGGDSGGPTIVTQNGIGVGIAGVQSTCTRTGDAPGAPANPPWPWATGISACQYVSVEPVVLEISMTIRENPNCHPSPACLITGVIDYVLKQ